MLVVILGVSVIYVSVDVIFDVVMSDICFVSVKVCDEYCNF